MTKEDAYLYGDNYENFIRIAFQTYEGKHGASKALLYHMLMEDLGHPCLTQPYSKQLKQVQGYLIKAIAKFMKRKPTPEERAGLGRMKEEVTTATKANELVQPILDGLAITARFQNL